MAAHVLVKAQDGSAADARCLLRPLTGMVAVGVRLQPVEVGGRDHLHAQRCGHVKLSALNSADFPEFPDR